MNGISWSDGTGAGGELVDEGRAAVRAPGLGEHQHVGVEGEAGVHRVVRASVHVDAPVQVEAWRR